MLTHFPQVPAKGGGDRLQRCWKHSERWGQGQESAAWPWEGAPKANSAQLLLSPSQMVSPGAEPAMTASSNATQAGASPELPLHCSSSFRSPQRGCPAGCVSVMAQPELALEAAPIPAQQNSNHTAQQTDRQTSHTPSSAQSAAGAVHLQFPPAAPHSLLSRRRCPEGCPHTSCPRGCAPQSGAKPSLLQRRERQRTTDVPP